MLSGSRLVAISPPVLLRNSVQCSKKQVDQIKPVKMPPSGSSPVVGIRGWLHQVLYQKYGRGLELDPGSSSSLLPPLPRARQLPLALYLRPRLAAQTVGSSLAAVS